MSWGIWPICCSVSFQGRCECRRDMKWNNEAQECQVCKFLILKYYNIPLLFLTLKIFMDVDCSTITYETPPSSAVLSAVEKAKAELASVGSNLTQETLERWERKKKTACVCQIFIGTTQDSDEGGEPSKLPAEADWPKKQHCRSDQGGLLQRHWCFQLWIFGKIINLTTHGKFTWRR